MKSPILLMLLSFIGGNGSQEKSCTWARILYLDPCAFRLFAGDDRDRFYIEELLKVHDYWTSRCLL